MSLCGGNLSDADAFVAKPLDKQAGYLSKTGIEVDGKEVFLSKNVLSNCESQNYIQMSFLKIASLMS